MRLVSLSLLCLALAAPAFAQSARVKATATPTPKPIVGPSAVFMPAHAKPDPLKSPQTPATKADPDEIIRVDSVLVPIPASILDVNGRAVGNLSLADFELKIDGRVVEIGEMSRSETPIRLAMLFDNSSSVMLAREFEKQAALRFFRRVIRPDKDLAALFSVADYTRLEQPFTNDISLLTNAIEMFPEPKGATALLDGIVKVAEYLKSANGRRIVVIVSDGEDTYSDLETTLEAVLRSLQMSDCQVYVVKTKDFENFKRTGVRGGNANIRALTAERRMIEIAAQTGGAVFSPIDEAELKDAFDRISAELSQQYVLSYYPESDSDKRGQFRAISIAIKGKQHLSARARKGYYVPKR
ncbi:MAG TPA: VWA domain-containing protein [Pyrinomonadaceae bacterium]|nr:VWA domain-containing protein [Pyrinomonadaceae bacterium]